MAKKARQKPPAIVPRRGPATNLRPAGAHVDETVYDRKKEKAALEREIAESGSSPSGVLGAASASDC